MKWLLGEEMFIGGYLPEWLAEREEVSPGAKVVYARLLQFAQKKKGERLRAWPGILVLASAVGLSDRQTKRHVAELRELRLIEVEDRRARCKSNIFFFPVHPWMGAPESWHKCAKSRTTPPPKPQDIYVPRVRTDMSPGSGHMWPGIEEKNQGKESKGKESISTAGAVAGGPDLNPALPGASKAEDPACFPSNVDLVPQAKESSVQLRLRKARVAEEDAKTRTRKQKRANATKQLARMAVKEQKAANLKGKQAPPSMRKQLKRCEQIWLTEMAACFPDLVFAKSWDGRERGMCRTLIERYSGPLIEQALHYLITEWDSISGRNWKRQKKGTPCVRVLSALHASLVPESQQFAVFAKVKAERAAWFKANPHSVHLPSDLKKRFADAKKSMEGQAA